MVDETQNVEPRSPILPPDRSLRPIWHPETHEMRMVDVLNYHDMTTNVTPRWVTRNPEAPLAQERVMDVAGQTDGVDLFPVWDPRGNKHMVDGLNARDLVEKLGWFNKAPPGSAEAPPPADTSTPPRPPAGSGEAGAALNVGKPLTPGTPLTEVTGGRAAGVSQTIDPNLPPGSKLPEAPVGSNDSIELTAMSPEALRMYAKAKFDLDFNADVAPASIIDAILQETA